MFSPRSACLRRAGLLLCLLASVPAQAAPSGDPVGSPLLPTSPARPIYSQLVVFGDSLSDTGNVADTTEAELGIRYPSGDFNYADGRFTDDAGTTPAAAKYSGVWHEQLAQFFLAMEPAKASLDGGSDYAFGDAETLDGQREIALVDGGASIRVDNLGQQVANYLGNHANADPNALYIVWGGANDLFADDSAANVTTAAGRETALVRRLAEAGATTLLVPNVPPLGFTPQEAGDAARSATLNQAAADFRSQLNDDLDALQATLAAEGLTVTIFRLDVFELFSRLNASSGAAYGFTNIHDSAQDENVKADQTLFWDGLHPTTAGHFQIAAEAFTLLSGAPVLEVFPQTPSISRNAGQTGVFLLTRTGADLSGELVARYKVGGTAVAGLDYAALPGQKKLKAGKRTVKIKVLPTTAGTAEAKVKLILGDDANYALPVIPKAAIKLDAAGQ